MYMYATLGGCFRQYTHVYMYTSNSRVNIDDDMLGRGEEGLAQGSESRGLMTCMYMYMYIRTAP